MIPLIHNQMKNTYFKSLLFKHLMTFKKYSILRISQIEALLDSNISGTALDVGGKKTPNNISNYLKSKVTYLDKFASGENDLKIDLEEKFSEENIAKVQFDNVLLMNVLEHIFNFKNCLKICYYFTKDGGKLFGSTPFLYRVHPSPNDYFRYTEEALEKIISEAGYKNIVITPLVGGIFISFYSNIFLASSKIPFLNNFMLPIILFLDNILFFFTKNYKKIMPIGYFFTATK